jgi:hypothetical protein
MQTPKNNQSSKSYKTEGILIFLCFLASGLIGYLLTNFVTLF